MSKNPTNFCNNLNTPLVSAIIQGDDTHVFAYPNDGVHDADDANVRMDQSDTVLLTEKAIKRGTNELVQAYIDDGAIVKVPKVRSDTGLFPFKTNHCFKLSITHDNTSGSIIYKDVYTFAPNCEVVLNTGLGCSATPANLLSKCTAVPFDSSVVLTEAESAYYTKYGFNAADVKKNNWTHPQLNYQWKVVSSARYSATSGTTDWNITSTTAGGIEFKDFKYIQPEYRNVHRDTYGVATARFHKMTQYYLYVNTTDKPVNISNGIYYGGSAYGNIYCINSQKTITPTDPDNAVRFPITRTMYRLWPYAVDWDYTYGAVLPTTATSKKIQCEPVPQLYAQGTLASQIAAGSGSGMLSVVGSEYIGTYAISGCYIPLRDPNTFFEYNASNVLLEPCAFANNGDNSTKLIISQSDTVVSAGSGALDGSVVYSSYYTGNVLPANVKLYDTAAIAYDLNSDAAFWDLTRTRRAFINVDKPYALISGYAGSMTYVQNAPFTAVVNLPAELTTLAEGGMLIEVLSSKDTVFDRDGGRLSFNTLCGSNVHRSYTIQRIIHDYGKSWYRSINQEHGAWTISDVVNGWSDWEQYSVQSDLDALETTVNNQLSSKIGYMNYASATTITSSIIQCASGNSPVTSAGVLTTSNFMTIPQNGVLVGQLCGRSAATNKVFILELQKANGVTVYKRPLLTFYDGSNGNTFINIPVESGYKVLISVCNASTLGANYTINSSTKFVENNCIFSTSVDGGDYKTWVDFIPTK